MAAIVLRALFQWIAVLLFLIFCVLKIDDRLQWNWFLVFLPMWISDCISVLYLVINLIVKDWKARRRLRRRCDSSTARKVVCLIGVLLKIAFQVLLCSKLEGVSNMAWYYVAVPLWLLLSMYSVEVMVSICQKEV